MGRKDVPKKAKRKSKRSQLQEKLVAAIQATNLPMPVEEHKFARSIGRLWRFDLAWPSLFLAVEVQGGTYVHGAHSRGAHQHNDYDKVNAAQLLGWKVLYFDTVHLRDLDATIQTIRDMIGRCAHAN